MDRNDWAIVIRYYEACWSQFSVESLGNVLSDNIVFVYLSVTRGKVEVLELFNQAFFNNVDINKTKIDDFSMSASQSSKHIIVKYAVSQETNGFTDQTLRLQEEFTVQDGLITSIVRTELH